MGWSDRLHLSVYDLRYTFAHEIGHAVGPRASDEVMSPWYAEAFRTLQPGDRNGAVALYRPNPAATVVRAGADAVPGMTIRTAVRD